MKVFALKTEKITVRKQTFFEILDKYLPSPKDGSILAVTSKIIAICEGSVVKAGTVDKKELAQNESELYIPLEKSKYDVLLTIKNGLLIATSGIDESNGNGYYILWPKNPQKTANEIRQYLVTRFKLKRVGVIITDSKTTPLRWGTSGITLAHSGFLALKNYIGQPDIFGRHLKMTKANIYDSISVAAVLVMGEGQEQTPLAIIEDLPFVTFQSRNPTPQELADLKISLADDLYAPLLLSAPWKKGGK